jgi:hypothetical protein
MDTPLTITIPRNEITIIVMALFLSVIYNTQTGLGVWASISLTSTLAILVLGSLFLMRTSNLKGVFLTLLVGFIISLTGIMITFNLIFYKNLPEELQDGYRIPIISTSILQGLFLVGAVIIVVLLSMNMITITQSRVNTYDTVFSIVITLVLVNAGIMAGA